MADPTLTIGVAGSLTCRILPPEEYPRLVELPNIEGLGSIVPRPDRVGVVVLEDKLGTIKGYWMVCLVPHTEPLWVHPDARYPRAQTLLIKGMTDLLQAMGGFGVIVIDDDNIAEMARHLGYHHVPGRVFSLTLPPIVEAPS